MRDVLIGLGELAAFMAIVCIPFALTFIYQERTKDDA